MSGGRILPGVPRLRRAVHRHDDRTVPAARHPRHMGQALPHDGFSLSGGHRANASAGSSRRGWSTRARSRCTGASIAGRRWPKPKSNTPITCRRRSTSSFRWRPKARRELGVARSRARGRDVSVVIWTTTPWTIPSNLAIAFHPEFDYAAYDVDGRAVIMAEALAPRVAEATGLDARRTGRQDEGETARAHPLPPSACTTRDSIARAGRLRHARCRHRRGSHRPGTWCGRLPHRPEIRSRDLRAGRTRRTFSRDASSCSPGSACSTPMPSVEQALKERSRLLHRSNFSHQYPHCWRCHNPVIFLATSQWFIRMDGEPVDCRGRRIAATLRRAALHAIDTGREMDSVVGARPHLQHGRRDGRTGASRGSASGACRFLRSTARSAARR